MNITHCLDVALPQATRITVGVLVLTMGCRAPQPGSRSGPSPEEEVNVGYGSQNRGNLTGSVVSLTAAEMEGAPAASMERMLRGRLPGLQIRRVPGGDISIFVRGSGPMRDANPPHVVIDGMTSSARDLLALSPEVVARIDVLKDAAASVYGMRGANGVILVTTKRAR